MPPKQRRIVQAILYETFGVAFISPALSFVFEESLASTIVLSVLVSALALGWNYAFNFFFENWERHQTVKGRSWKRRLVHGLGFEGGLALMLVPLTAWWLEISLLEAIFTEASIVAFFFVYAVMFTWTFDRVFGLPESALDNPIQPKSD